jgi:hypothetical protein
MCFRDPFENLMLSNRASYTNGMELNADGPNFDNWRRGGDSVRGGLNAIGNLQIPHCRAYRGCQCCHASLPDIARQKLG